MLTYHHHINWSSLIKLLSYHLEVTLYQWLIHWFILGFNSFILQHLHQHQHYLNTNIGRIIVVIVIIIFILIFIFTFKFPNIAIFFNIIIAFILTGLEIKKAFKDLELPSKLLCIISIDSSSDSSYFLLTITDLFSFIVDSIRFSSSNILTNWIFWFIPTFNSSIGLFILTSTSYSLHILDLS